jgi:hypothetical protein
MYKLQQPDTLDNTVKVVQRIADNTFIPFDTANIDYQAYLAWLAEGNQPLPADE